MPKIKSKNFIISLVIYPFDVMVSVGETDEVLFKKLTKGGVLETELDGAKYEEIGLARYCSFSTGQTLIRLKKKPYSPTEYGTLQHEIFHAVATVMWKVGMKLRILVSDEAYAYLVGYLTKEIYSKL